MMTVNESFPSCMSEPEGGKTRIREGRRRRRRRMRKGGGREMRECESGRVTRNARWMGDSPPSGSDERCRNLKVENRPPEGGELQPRCSK